MPFYYYDTPGSRCRSCGHSALRNLSDRPLYCRIEREDPGYDSTAWVICCACMDIFEVDVRDADFEDNPPEWIERLYPNWQRSQAQTLRNVEGSNPPSRTY